MLLLCGNCSGMQNPGNLLYTLFTDLVLRPGTDPESCIFDLIDDFFQFCHLFIGVIISFDQQSAESEFTMILVTETIMFPGLLCGSEHIFWEEDDGSR